MPDYIYQTQRTTSPYGEPVRYPEGLVALGSDCYAWLSPNGEWGASNAGLIVGDGESLLIDTLWDLPSTRQMLDGMQSITGESPIRYTLNTHADGDHWYGNQLVADSTILSTSVTAEDMLRNKPVKMHRLERAARLIKLLSNRQAGYYIQQIGRPYDFDGIKPVYPARVFEGQITLEVGGRFVQLIEAGAFHTRSDMVVYLPEEKILFAGDVVWNGSTPVMWHGPIQNWIAALDRILALNVDVVVPGHGPITDKDGVKQMRQYWIFWQTELNLRRDMKMSPLEAVRDIGGSIDFMRKPFARWASPERVLISAIMHNRHQDGRPRPLSSWQLVKALSNQAVLAKRVFSTAPPAIMRR